jgi:hypothetical protein
MKVNNFCFEILFQKIDPNLVGLGKTGIFCYSIISFAFNLVMYCLFYLTKAQMIDKYYFIMIK